MGNPGIYYTKALVEFILFDKEEETKRIIAVAFGITEVEDQHAFMLTMLVKHGRPNYELWSKVYSKSVMDRVHKAAKEDLAEIERRFSNGRF